MYDSEDESLEAALGNHDDHDNHDDGENRAELEPINLCMTQRTRAWRRRSGTTTTTTTTTLGRIGPNWKPINLCMTQREAALGNHDDHDDGENRAELEAN